MIKNQNRFSREERGITLIALVVTIVVLIILATVSISAVMGEDGIIAKAQLAKNMHANSIEKEQSTMDELLQEYANAIDGETSIDSGNHEDNQRKINVEYTKSEGEDLWSSTVTFTISFEEETNLTIEKKKEKAIKSFNCANYEEFKIVVENLATEIYGINATYDQLVAQQGEEELLDMVLDLIVLEQKRELAAYMVDFSSYEEFKSAIEYTSGATYEEAISNFGDEESFLNFIIDSMKNTLSYIDIDKLESLGVKVASIKTPYDTTLYTSSLGGEVKCTFAENGTYTFPIESGEIKTQQTVKIDNIRTYSTEKPYTINLENGACTAYSIDDSTERLEGASIFECNDSITVSASNSYFYRQYTFLNKDFYKYFYSGEEWEKWFKGYTNIPHTIAYLAASSGFTVRQFILMSILENNSLITDLNAIFDYKLVDCAQEIQDFMNNGELEGFNPIYLNDLKRFPEELLAKCPQLSLCYTELPENGVFKFTEDTHLYIYYSACLTTDTYVEVVVWDEEKKKKIRIRKKLKDITYEDELLVWDFDKGEFTEAKPLWIMKQKVATRYNLLKFSDGSELKTIDQHRIFNKEAGKFTYPMTDETPIGTTTYTAEGKEVKLVSKEVISEQVEYTNIITKYHINVFANNILTSCRFSNLYPIENMKYVKDDRRRIEKEEYENIPEEYYYGLRLAEQPRKVNNGNDVRHAKSIEEHIQNVYIANAKEK